MVDKTKAIDVRFNQDNGYFDFDIAEDGDFELTEGLDTALPITFYTNQRADASENKNSLNRGGWYGNLLSIYSTEIGSKIWLLLSDVISDQTRVKVEGFARDAYQYLLDLKLVDDLSVKATVTTTKISITIMTTIGSDVTQTNLDLWRQTNVVS